MLRLLFVAGLAIGGAAFVEDLNLSLAASTLVVGGAFVAVVIYALLRDA
ncbi:hypothetical protein [Salinarimonas sp.]